VAIFLPAPFSEKPDSFPRYAYYFGSSEKIVGGFGLGKLGK
jgi:hypothetical protein